MFNDYTMENNKELAMDNMIKLNIHLENIYMEAVVNYIIDLDLGFVPWKGK